MASLGPLRWRSQQNDDVLGILGTVVGGQMGTRPHNLGDFAHVMFYYFGNIFVGRVAVYLTMGESLRVLCCTANYRMLRSWHGHGNA